MVNSVAGAKLSAVPENFCTLDDVELVFSGVQDVYYINEDGGAESLKETYADESYFAYFYCNGCQEQWHSSDGNQDEMTEKVLAHLAQSKS